MANEEHLALLRQGVEVWNQWRQAQREVRPDLYESDMVPTDLFEATRFQADLSKADLRRADLRRVDLSGDDLFGADLRRADLSGADLRQANLSRADLFAADLSAANLSEADLSAANLFEVDLFAASLSGANLREANLSDANLRRADLSGANLREANLSRAEMYLTGLSDLSGAILSGASLRRADLSGASLRRADLSGATLIDTNLTKATLKDCRIYGISVWDVHLDGAEQLNLIITPEDQPTITVDNLKVAQFIYLLLNNAEIRHVIDTITSKVVLILGRFSPERKAVLDALREELRKHDYLPVLFDFEKPTSRDLTETVSTLAHLARFIIADLTEPNSIPHEVATIIPQLKVPVQPLLVQGDAIHEYPMFRDLRMYPWVLPIARYEDMSGLLAVLNEQVIEPAERKAKE